MDKLKLDPHNANKGTDRGRKMVRESLEETGAGRSIVVDKDGRVIAGNKTFEAWQENGGEVEVVRTDGTKLVVVQRDDLDLDHLDGKARKLAYLDNRSSEVGLAWDIKEVLASIDAGLDLDGLWNQDEIDSLLANIRSPEFGPGSIDEQGKLDELADKSVECPNCGERFTP